MSKELRQANKTADSVFDRIYKFHHSSKSKVELTAEEKGICERWEKAWLLLTTANPDKKVADELKNIYDISISTAYDDLRHAKMLYGDPRIATKQMSRSIAASMALTKHKEADERGDHDMAERYFNRWLEITGVKDHSDGNGSIEEMMKKFKAHQIVIVSKMKDLQAEAEKLREQITIDIPHAEG
jgi:hypothetical protein